MLILLERNGRFSSVDCWESLINAAKKRRKAPLGTTRSIFTQLFVDKTHQTNIIVLRVRLNICLSLVRGGRGRGRVTRPRHFPRKQRGRALSVFRTLCFLPTAVSCREFFILFCKRTKESQAQKSQYPEIYIYFSFPSLLHHILWCLHK